MRIQIPKVIVGVDLAGYAPELAGQLLQVWVNPPMEKLQAYSDLLLQVQEREVETARQTLFPEPADGAAEEPSALRKFYEQVVRILQFKQQRPAPAADQALLEWYAEIWSQGAADTRWTVEELRTLEAQDPAFLAWMISATWSARAEHVERKKKA